MRILMIVALAMMLQGCLFNILKPQSDDVTLHPELPRPVQTVDIDWKVIETEDGVMVGTTYNQFLDMLEYESDQLRYTKQINRTVCSYRVELEEPICLQFNKEEE